MSENGYCFLKAAIAALITVMVCTTLFFHTATQAAVSETVIVLDDSGDAAGELYIDLFKTAYISASGDMAVQSRDGKKLIAPGMSGERRICLKNENAYAVEYEIRVDTDAVDGPESTIPIYVRTSARTDSPKEWRAVAGSASELLRGALSAGQEMNFYYQWRWDDGDDEVDTWLAGEYANMRLNAVVNVSAQERISGTSDQKSGSDSQDSDGALSIVSLVRSAGSTGQRQDSYHKSGPGEYGWINIPQTGEWFYSALKTDGGSIKTDGDLVTVGGGLMTTGGVTSAFLDTKSLYAGWLYESRDGRWYYLAPGTGRMCEGWREIDGYWYYFTTRRDADEHAWRSEYTTAGYTMWNYYGQGAHSYGAMYVDEYTPDGYFVDSEGRWVEGG